MSMDFDFSFLDDIDLSISDDLINYDKMINDLVKTLKDLYKMYI